MLITMMVTKRAKLSINIGMDDIKGLQEAYAIVLEKLKEHKKEMHDLMDKIDKEGNKPSDKQKRKIEELRVKIRDAATKRVDRSWL